MLEVREFGDEFRPPFSMGEDSGNLSLLLGSMNALIDGFFVIHVKQILAWVSCVV